MSSERLGRARAGAGEPLLASFIDIRSKAYSSTSSLRDSHYTPYIFPLFRYEDLECMAPGPAGPRRDFTLQARSPVR